MKCSICNGWIPEGHASSLNLHTSEQAHLGCIEGRAIQDQPPPTASEGDVMAEVIADLTERRRVGIERYGTPLQPFNGRKALVDAYQEGADLLAYLKQEMIERERLEDQLAKALARIADLEAKR